MQLYELIHLTDQEFLDLKSFVYHKYGIDLSKKRQLIEGRLSHTLKDKGLTSFSQYMKLLQNDPSSQEIHTFLNKITTNHSYFGRENEHFDFLHRVVLPELERTRHGDLRIWSAGCSAGQEAYNIAMTIDQYFGAKKAQWDTTILATDISMDVLNKAKQACYPADNIEGLSPAWRSQYFNRLSNGQFQVCDKIRKEVVFRPFNLMDPFQYKKPFDIIFCRNVMIYFDKETTERLVQKFYDASANGAYFFIGHSESLNKATTPFTYLQPATYQKRINAKGAR